MSALVTGAGGFVGSHLIEALEARGEDVTCFLYENSDGDFINPEEHTTVRGDIRDPGSIREAVAGHDEVYHLAALLNHAKPTTEEFFETNVMGTRNVMEAALEEGVEKVVYTSSRVAIDENRPERLHETMRHPGFFNNGYTMSKYKGEKVVFEYGARGIDVNTVHPTLIYGPRETNTLAPLMRTYLHPPIRFKGYVDSLFDFIYVKDVAEGHIAAMERGRPGERYILGGEERSIGEFLALLDELTGT
jgi:nucleoside-diphosphate-sugar epimerase